MRATAPSLTNRIAVAMIGARRHYAVPVLLDRAGVMARFYTDVYPRQGWLRLARPLLSAASGNGHVRRLLRRECGVSAARITAFNTLGLRYWWRLKRARSMAEREAAYQWMGAAFGSRVSRTRWDAYEGVYAFNGAAGRLFEHARSRGVCCILDQTIAPRRIYEQLLSEEILRWPAWSEPLSSNPFLREQEEAEWQLADAILAGSPFVRDGLLACGVPAHKCRVVPCGTDTRAFTVTRAENRERGRLHVLFVGSVGLRKGVPYLLRAARALGDLVNVRIVGPLDCPAQCLDSLVHDNTQVVGPVPRGELLPHFAWADVLCLPSLCEGSAAVTYEARAAGVPVICTSNTGATVTDGVDGFVVPIRDAERLAERLEQLARDRPLLRHMGRQAAEKVESDGWDQYGARLVTAVKQAVKDN